jgi:amidohydrolase
MGLDSLIDQHAKSATELRHRLHRIPELGYEETKTASAIRHELGALGIEYIAGVEEAPTATIAWIGDTSKPCVALRADIDALPIHEQTGLPYASTHAGRMHACGHDGHTSILIGTAAVLKSIASELNVCVKFLFQPAEEGGGGGDVLCKAGALDGRIGPKVSAIFGLHGWPGLAVGSVSTKAGPLLAATDTFTANFIGKGCHAAFPHVGKDPVITACEAILNVQQFITRELDPTEPCVITIPVFKAGTAANVIPDRAMIMGTARTLSEPARVNVQASIRRRFAAIAAANECEVEISWDDGYPPTINDPKMSDYVTTIARQALGQDRFLPAARPAMGGEDFAYYLQQVPGCFFFVGVSPPGVEEYPSLHNDRFDFTDAAIPVGIRMFVELVRNFSK